MTQHTADSVLETIGYEAFVRGLYNRTGDLSKDFTHAVLGMITESHEYLMATDRVNAIEEAGDLCFYLSALRQVLDDVHPVDVGDTFTELVATAYERMMQNDFDFKDAQTEWMDLAKRWIGYGKAPTMSTTDLLAEASAMHAFVMDAGLAGDCKVQTVIRANVEKLLKRYNGLAFNADKAVNRDTAAERDALESAVG